MPTQINGRFKMGGYLLGLVLASGGGYYADRIRSAAQDAVLAKEVEALQKDHDKFVRKDVLEPQLEIITEQLRRLEDKLDRSLSRRR